MKPLAGNRDVADIFYRMAVLLELQGANPYRIRAYNRAAQTVEQLNRPLGTLTAEEILALPGIGRDLASKVSEILLTGSLRAYLALEHTLEPGLLPLLTLPGLGPKKVRQLITQLPIRNLDDLALAAERRQIRQLPGFGPKSEANIQAAIARHRGREARWLLVTAEEAALPLVDYLQGILGVELVAVAGSFRRQKEIVEELVLVASGQAASPVMEAFIAYPLCREVLSHCPTQSRIRLHNGLEVDLRFVPPASYGAALYYLTGSKEHNLAVRRMARRRGLKLNEYGVFRGNRAIAGETEASVFRAVGLPWIPPVLRENQGEIEAAQRGELPRLIERGDIRGDLHLHTVASDGRNTLWEMATAAQSDGLDYIAITEHSQSTARGLTPERFRQHLGDIDALRERVPGLMVLKGAEVDILRGGALDLPDDLLADLDIVVASIHNHFDLPEAEQTARLLQAIHHPLVHVIGHPSARRLPDRPPIRVDWAAIFQAAAAQGVWLEINAAPNRLDLNGELIRQAKAAGVGFVLSTDAHNVNHYANRRFGIAMAQRGWLEPGDVLNTLPAEAFRQALQGRRRREKSLVDARQREYRQALKPAL